MKFTYETDTGRIVRRYWGKETPDWLENPPGGCETAEEPEFSQNSRSEQLQQAKDEYEAGEDYDPETETVTARLWYDAESGEVYGEAEVEDLPENV